MRQSTSLECPWVKKKKRSTVSLRWCNPLPKMLRSYSSIVEQMRQKGNECGKPNNKPSSQLDANPTSPNNRPPIGDGCATWCFAQRTQRFYPRQLAIPTCWQRLNAFHEAQEDLHMDQSRSRKYGMKKVPGVSQLMIPNCLKMMGKLPKLDD